MSGDVAGKHVLEEAFCLRGQKSLLQGRVFLSRKCSIRDMFCPRVNICR
ncbi:hypothetical protein Gotur_005193 [Gossypium turneri]